MSDGAWQDCFLSADQVDNNGAEDESVQEHDRLAVRTKIRSGGRLYLEYRVPNPTPSSTREKAGRNHLNEEITPLLPTGIGERFSQTITNLGHAALLLRCELPL